ncbi:hypothetical protein NPX13_g6524 [Xylaria arbuscula]|uniref:CFEM domain-containing protein n=1 Tax=Xylaria arbuscula TaxID=114810 RepID=A0A9W8NCF9_9PEZI|nr:hypothetical protein NPX13_g6524 [Xylaria arbuscula]
MKYAVATLAYFFAAASAQSLSDIPACALPCIDDARTKATDCAADDYQCICSHVEALSTAATECVLGECGQDVAIQQVLPAVTAFCQAVNNGGGETPEPTSEPASTSEPTSETTSVPTVTATSTEVSSSSSASVPVTSSPGSTLTPTFGGGNATATASTSSLIPTAGAAIVNSMGPFAMVVLGALAAL